MAYIEWWNRTGPATLGERFGLNEISTARKTLSPTKSHTQVASNELNFPAHMIHEFEGGQLKPEEFYQYQSIPQSERPLTGAAGGRVDMKPGGIVEPGVTHYAKEDKMTLAELKEAGIKSKVFDIIIQLQINICCQPSS